MTDIVLKYPTAKELQQMSSQELVDRGLVNVNHVALAGTPDNRSIRFRLFGF